MFRALLIGLAVLGAAQAATAQPATDGAPVAPQPANAMQLARLLNPDDKIVAASDRAFRTGFEAALANDKETSAMLKEHPALLEAIYASAVPVVRKHVSAGMPRLHSRSAAFYAGRFTPAEIDQLIGFYGSPTGVKMVAGLYAGLDMGKIVDAIGPEGKGPLTGDTMKGVIGSAAFGILPTFEAADWKAFTEFTKSPVFVKVREATPDMLKMTADMANEPNPEFDAELEQVIGKTVQDYFAKADEAPAES